MTVAMRKQAYTMRIFSGARYGVKRSMMRGAAAVEFALLLIPMLLLALGVAEYGRAIYQYNTLIKSVRDSARLLSQFSPADASYPLADAKCLAVYGNTGCTGDVLAPGLTTAMVTITPTTTITTPPMTLVTVTITGYVFNFVLNPVSLFGSAANSITFGDIHATMRQL